MTQAHQVYWFRLSRTDDKVAIPSEQIPDPILQPTPDLIIRQRNFTALVRALRTMRGQKLFHGSPRFFRLPFIREKDENRDNRRQHQNSTESYLVERYTDKTAEDQQPER